MSKNIETNQISDKHLTVIFDEQVSAEVINNEKSQLLEKIKNEIDELPMDKIPILMDHLRQKLESSLSPTLSNSNIKDFSFYDKLPAKEKFFILKSIWRAERPATSSFLKDLINHPAYEEIIKMGMAVVPLILQNLDRNLDHWFEALHRITGVEPVPATDRGNLYKMAYAWQTWGEENGLY